MSNNQAIKQLVKDLGIDNLSQDAQSELIIKASEVLLKRIFIETMEKLSDQGREEYEKMVANNASPKQVEEFLKDNINNYEEMVQKVIDDFKEEIKNETSH